MTPALILAALTEIVKLLNWQHENMPKEAALAEAARWAKVLDFLFGWLDKIEKP